MSAAFHSGFTAWAGFRSEDMQDIIASYRFAQGLSTVTCHENSGASAVPRVDPLAGQPTFCDELALLRSAEGGKGEGLNR